MRKPNNLKVVGSRKTKGSKQENQNRPRLPMPEEDWLKF